MNSRRSVNLPAPCFNQYNVPVLPSSPHSVRADFAQFIARKFGRGHFLVLGPDREELERQFREAGLKATVCVVAELAARIPQNGSAPPAVLAIWFYPSDKSHDKQAAEEIAPRARDVLLVSGPGAEVAKRRPHLVECFRPFGLQPDYECDLGELEPAALRLARRPEESGDALVPAVESAFARLNRHVRGLERTLRTRISELDAADRHIAKLEEKLLKLKEAKRELKQLKQEKHALRKSPERKIGQVLLAPYRLPQKLLREVRKRFPKPDKSYRASIPANEYQEWLETRLVKSDELAALRTESGRCAFQPCISIIPPVFNTPVSWLTECVESVLAQTYEKWELILIDDGSTAPGTLRVLRELGARDSRIVLARDEKRAGISAASNR